MLQLRVRKLASWAAIILAVLVALEPGLGRLTPAVAASAQAQSLRALTGTSQTPQTPQVAPTPGSYLQLTLDLIVGQSATATGLKLVALNSTLGPQVPPSGAQANVNDSGQWHIELQDDKGQTLTLDGTLTYQIEGQVQTDASSNATITIAGALKGTGVEVAIDSLFSGGSANGHTTANGKFDVTLTRAGSTSHILITKAIDAAQIGYNLKRITTQNMIERDGNKAGWLQTVTTHDLGNGEQEVRLEQDVSSTTSQVPLLVVTQHFFQRTVGSSLNQYIDRFDVQMPDGTYSLQTPTTIEITTAGVSGYSFDLVNSQGKTIKISVPNSPQSLRTGPNQVSDLTGSTEGSPGLFSPLPAVANRGSNSLDSISSAVSDPAQQMAHTGSVPGGPGLFSPLPGVCSTLVNLVLGVALAVVLAIAFSWAWPAIFALDLVGIGEALTFLAGEVGEQVLQTFIGVVLDYMKAHRRPGDDAAAHANDALSLILQVSTAFITGSTPQNWVGAGGNLLQGILPILGFDPGERICNGDPYFAYPDIRLNSDPVNPSPLQITTVTGGILAPITGTVAATITTTAAVVLSPTTGMATNTQQYNDSPQPFVGGSIPKGAKAVGTWAWDSARPYGAMPSHTQPAADGPQMHYFIHAAEPLTPTAGDNIIQYVYLDPQNPPSELYLQFYTGDGNGEQRAYWGADSAQTGGQAGSGSLYPMGPLPQKGGWVRLQIPANELGLAGKQINGVLYGAYGGQTWWGPTTTSNEQTDGASDSMSVEPPPAPPTWTVGSLVAFRLAEPESLSVDIVDGQGKPVRTLLKDVQRQAGYQVLTWDAKNDSGAPVQDIPYQVRFSVGGKVVAQHGVTISPLVAAIHTPGAYSLVRGTQVPIVGEAYGNMFERYVLEYGEGVDPSTWITITESPFPSVALPGGNLKLFNPGNLANWDTGLNEFKPWDEAGLNGLYTLRLRVIGTDGREADDTFPVIVGRLASTAEGGTIASPDSKARLLIPYFATQDSFSLMALVPLSQTETVTDWPGMLPAGPKPVGDVYEVFPADEKFRRPATLELPYNGIDPPDQLGIMLGDGTPGGWRYIGGKADPQKHIITVEVMDFGGKRALVAPFASATFGSPPPDPNAAASLAFSDTLAAPNVASANGQIAFDSDLQSGPGEWTSLDLRGTKIEVATGADAGLSAGDAALKVTGQVGGARMVGAHTSPYDAAKYPILSFDYRVPAGYSPNLLVKSNGVWWQFWMGSGGTTTGAQNARYFETILSPQLVTDDTWHHYRLDLLGQLRLAEPDATSFQVDAIVFGQIAQTAYAQYVPVDEGNKGSAYYLDNLSASRPTGATGLSFSWIALPGVSYTGYSYALDQNRDTVPAENAQATSTNSTSAQVQLPPGAKDGLWYFHVRGQVTGEPGQWGAVAHYPVQIDRQPPTPGAPSPPPNGAGSPDLLELPLTDAGGIDMASLKLELGGKTYSPVAGGRAGLSYQPENQTLSIYSNQLAPPLDSQASGQHIQATLQTLTDYAGNSLAGPFSWSFTSDKAQTGADSGFKQLTAKGGTSPALSPDGSHVAFVSSRSGAQKIWVMRSDDYEEKAGSAVPLTTGDRANTNAHESDPVWSPDGSKLAYVSDTGGSPQVWVSAPDGTAAHALTVGASGAASPAWTGEGKSLVFIRDGNLWSVNGDGTGMRALTTYPEKPLRAVSAQPGGQLLAVAFRLYQQTIELYNPANGDLTPVTEGGQDTEPTWLNDSTLLYTAPSDQAGQAGLLAIWQVGLDGKGQSTLPGRSQAGVASMQAAVSPDGNVLALVSTESGDRNVWVRGNQQIGRLDVSPAAGAAAGQPFQVMYTLPSTGTVTLQVTDKDGKPTRMLVSGITQPKGVQQLTWDGKDSSGSVVAPGEYLFSLSARPGNSPELTRYATANVLESSNIGTVQVEIDQWTGQVASPNDTMHTRIYAAGTRTQPLVRADSESRPRFNLPAGRYDLTVEYNGATQEVAGLSVQGEKTVTQTVDMKLGGLAVTILSAPGQPVSGDASVQVSRSDDLSGAAQQYSAAGASTFVLPPGNYDVKAGYQGLEESAYNLQVKTGEVTRQEINLGSGLLSLTVDEQDGVPAGAGIRLVTQAFNPTDHKNPIYTSWDNPAELRLPAGKYDIQLSYGVTDSSPYVAGSITEWITGMEILPGQNRVETYNLKLTPTTFKVQEAAGKIAAPGKVSFNVYRQEDLTDSVAHVLTDTATFLLAEGEYEVVPAYDGTELEKAGPIGEPIEVKYGQSVEHTLDLKLGHISVEVRDANGQPVDPDGLSANVYPAGRQDEAFSQASTTNPLLLPVRADTLYDVIVEMKDGTKVSVQGVQVKEGETVTLEANAKDAK
jgi:Tol biopolymer transport system component